MKTWAINEVVPYVVVFHIRALSHHKLPTTLCRWRSLSRYGRVYNYWLFVFLCSFYTYAKFKVSHLGGVLWAMLRLDGDYGQLGIGRINNLCSAYIPYSIVTCFNFSFHIFSWFFLLSHTASNKSILCRSKQNRITYSCVNVNGSVSKAPVCNGAQGIRVYECSHQPE